jgi:type VI secretion system protein ImpL
MKAILKLLTNRWLIAILGLVFLACIIWILGPLIAIGRLKPLETELSRVVFIAAIVLFWAVRRLIAFVRSSKAQKQIVQGITQPVAAAEPDASAEEVAVLKERFEEAVEVLKKAKGRHGKANLYELPWYIIIGPPGSGKTTALLNSGLHFPLADRFGREAVQGVGGTRNCDWWFTDQAVLIDTAGRYVTQDSHAEVDRAAWGGFLDLLKKYRKRRPINGVFVAISISDLMTQDPGERQQHVAAIRKRIEELDEHFGIRFPIYVMLTKCDLVAGFAAFFENLGREDREQVWGMTFPLEDRSSERNPVDAFAGEYDSLVKRLNERLMWRLSQERDVARRAMIYRFPKQMASLRETLKDFLGDVFRASRYHEAPLVRGVYLCSGTQVGAPIDRMLGALAQTFDISPQGMPEPQGPGKSYFIADLLQKVAFEEAELAGANRKLERQRAWLQRAAYAGTGGFAVLTIIVWLASYSRNLSYVSAVAAKSAEANALIADISPRNIDPLEAVPALNATRELAHRDEDSGIQASFLQSFGLSQIGKLRDVGNEAYRRVLTEAFLPRIMLRMEEQMRRGGPTPDYSYAALRAYLSLDSRDHYDADMINAFLRLDWLDNLRRETSTEQRQHLEKHLDALLEQRPTPLPLPLDDALVVRTQADLRRMPLDERIYGRLLRRPVSEDIPGFSIRKAAGPGADLVFVRKSGAPLTESVPPLFTRTAYQSTFRSASRDLTRELLAETWVLGEEEEVQEAELDLLIDKVRARYLDDFAQRYTNLVLDVDLAPFTTASEAASIFRILSRDDSPLLLLLEELERQTSLDTVGEETKVTDRARDRIREAEEGLRDLIGTSRPADAGRQNAAIANLVEERFERLNALVKQVEGRPRPVDHLLELIEKLYLFMSTVASEQAGGAIPPHVVEQGQALIQELRIEAENQPDMIVGNMLAAASSRTAGLAFGGIRAHLNDLWQSGPLPFCRNAIEGRYPISRNATNDIRIDDFARFFGYNQMMDQFFSTHLRQYIDSSRTPWQIRRTGNAPLQLSAEAIRAFERADAIKQTFFGFGGAQPTVGFNLKPIDMDASVGRFLLHLEGQEISWDHGPQISTFVQWPGPSPGSEVRMEMRDTQTGQTHMRRQQGPWAWFRILDMASITSVEEREHFEVVFNIDGRNAIYELVARSAYNPFRFEQLESFSCPDRL